MNPYTPTLWAGKSISMWVWMCLLIYFWRISLVNHLLNPSKTNDSSPDADLRFHLSLLIFFPLPQGPCFLATRERERLPSLCCHRLWLFRDRYLATCFWLTIIYTAPLHLTHWPFNQRAQTNRFEHVFMLTINVTGLTVAANCLQIHVRAMQSISKKCYCFVSMFIESTS